MSCSKSCLNRWIKLWAGEPCPNNLAHHVDKRCRARQNALDPNKWLSHNFRLEKTKSLHSKGQCNTRLHAQPCACPEQAVQLLSSPCLVVMTFKCLLLTLFEEPGYSFQDLFPFFGSTIPNILWWILFLEGKGALCLFWLGAQNIRVCREVPWLVVKLVARRWDTVASGPGEGCWSPCVMVTVRKIRVKTSGIWRNQSNECIQMYLLQGQSSLC